MATSKKGKGGARGVARRRKGAPRKKLSPELEALARGDEDALRRPRKERLRDPRPVALVPGVANRDARAVADARVTAMRAMIEWEDRSALETALADLVALRLWRGRSVTSLESFAEDLLDLPVEEAKAAAARGAERSGRSLEPLGDVAVASWLRTEAALLEAEVDARVTIDGEGRLILDIPAVRAPEAFDALGRRFAPLLEDRRGPRRPPRDGGDRSRDGRDGGKEGRGRRPERKGGPPRRDKKGNR